MKFEYVVTLVLELVTLERLVKLVKSVSRGKNPKPESSTVPATVVVGYRSLLQSNC